LLVLMAVVFVMCRSVEDQHPALGFIRAFAEAAMIGALADWFAVIALFRHPLGIPIPHTAIVPANQSRIGESLARFVRESFLAPEALTPKLKEWRVVHRCALWLKDRSNAEQFAASCASSLSGILHALDDEALSKFLRGQASAIARKVPLAPLSATVLDALMDSGREQEIISGLLRWLVKFVTTNQEFLRDRIREELPLGGKVAFGAIRQMVAARIASRLAHKVEETLEEVLSDPAHELRIHLHAEMIVLAERLRDDEELGAKLESWKDGLLQHEGMLSAGDAIWSKVKQSAAADLKKPDAETSLMLTEAFHRVGDAIAANEELQSKLETWLSQGIASFVGRHSSKLESFMRDTVKSWDAETLVQKLESEVGADLQFIRINGTLVGGCVGLVIHTVERWM